MDVFPLCIDISKAKLDVALLRDNGKLRRRSLSFMISLKSATGRISTGPSPYLKPGSCEIS